MNYCHECGSEIAEIDTFCPYCGISLKPAFASDEQDKTIAVNQSDLQDLQPQTDSQPVEKAEESFSNSDNLPPEISEEPEQKTEFESEKTNAENSEFIEKEIELTEEKGLEDSVQDHYNQLKNEITPDDATLIDVPRPQVLGEAIETQSETSTAEPTTENQIPEFGLIEIEENELSDISSSDLNIETESENQIEAVESDIPEKDEETVQTIPQVKYEELIKAEPDADISESQDSTASNSEAVIEKPENPVEENEYRDTTFDSVKIMDDGKNETVEDQPEILSTTDVKSDQNIEPDVEPCRRKTAYEYDSEFWNRRHRRAQIAKAQTA